MTEPHTCISKDKKRWRREISSLSDADLKRNLDWSEFTFPLTQTNRVWRIYCGLAIREAERRGLPIPIRRTS